MMLCKWLYWKGVHNHRESEQLVRYIFRLNKTPYTCMRNCQSTGPDGKVAAPEQCVSDRKCFERYIRRVQSQINNKS